MKFRRYLIVMLLALFMILFVGCKNDNNQDKGNEDTKQGETTDPNENKDPKEEPKEHVHNYNVKSLNDKFKVSDATCVKGSVYYFSCECGEQGTTTFEANDVKGHNFEKGSYFYTSKEVLGVIVPEGTVRVFFTCSECLEEVYKDYQVSDHEHICHEATSHNELSHSATCSICNENYNEACTYDEFNECIFCGNDKAPEYMDNLWKMAKDNVETVTQNDVKAYYFGASEDVYNDITVTRKIITYNKDAGCILDKSVTKFQYELETNNYYISQTDRTEISVYGWFPVSFKISKCVDAVGITYYYKFANGNIGIYFSCNGECTTDTYHEFNAQGQLLVFKSLQHVSETNEVLTVYTYSYGKQW